MIQIIHGNLLETNAQIIAHQVNCRGVAKSGIAKQIMKKYPEVKALYTMLCKRETPEKLIGTALFAECKDGKIIANLFGQNGFGRDRQYTEYEALDNAMKQLREFMLTKGYISVAFPYKIGCGLGGGDWNVVKLLIDKHFRDFECYVCEL